MNEVTMFESVDGTIFDSKVEATKHDLEIMLKKLGLSRIARASIFTHFDELYPYFYEYSRWKGSKCTTN
jgi:hypothetical protein